METKIRPYFKNRQAFPLQIVFGFCLGPEACKNLTSYCLSLSCLVKTQPLATTDSEKIAKKFTTGGIYPLSPTGVDPEGGPGL